MSQAAVEVQPCVVPGQRTFFGRPFPLVLECRTPDAAPADVTNWIGSHRDELGRQAGEHGAVLLRGFPVLAAEDFDRFVAAFGYRNFAYEQSLSNAVRTNLTKRVFTANEAPSDVAIYLHHEMAQTPVFPSRLFFYCQRPADGGGATPICRSDVLLDQLSEQAGPFVRACEERGLKYTNVMPPHADSTSGMGRSWRSTLRAETRRQAEQRLHSLGYSWEWLPDGSLRATTPRLPAVRKLPSGRKSFFNQLIAAYYGWKDSRNDPTKSVTFGDGSPLDSDSLSLAAELAERITFDVVWRQGDVCLVDNYLAMHGRRTFAGTRQVLASLVAGDG